MSAGFIPRIRDRDGAYTMFKLRWLLYKSFQRYAAETRRWLYKGFLGCAAEPMRWLYKGFLGCAAELRRWLYKGFLGCAAGLRRWLCKVFSACTAVHSGIFMRKSWRARSHLPCPVQCHMDRGMYLIDDEFQFLKLVYLKLWTWNF